MSKRHKQGDQAENPDPNWTGKDVPDRAQSLRFLARDPVCCSDGTAEAVPEA